MNQATVVAHVFKQLVFESNLFVKMIYYMHITKCTLSKYMHEFIKKKFYYINNVDLAICASFTLVDV